jgi:hypothetical protein
MSERNNEFCWKDSVTLKEYFNIRLVNLEQSIIIAKESMDKRLEGMNEFRNSLKDQNSTFIPRQEFEAKHEILVNKIDSMQKMIYIAIGGLLVIEIILRYLK